MRLVSRLVRLSAIIACLCSVILVWQAVPACADGTDPGFPGSVVHVSASGSLTPGSVLTITATGTNAPDKYDPNTGYAFGLDLFLVSADVLKTSCATSEAAELTLSTNNPTAVDYLTVDALIEGMSGAFKISRPVRLNEGTGHLLICAYSVSGFTDVAWASTEVLIGHGHGGGGSVLPPGGSTQPGATAPSLTHKLRRLFIVPLVWTGLIVLSGGITLAVLGVNGTLRRSRKW